MPSRFWRRAGGVILLAMLTIPGARSLSRSMMFPGDEASLPSTQELARIGLEPLDVTTQDGLRLRGVFAPPAGGATSPVVVFFHGNAESVARNLDLAVTLHANGWGVALAEYRGYGGMPGTPSETGLYTDAEAAIDALRERGVPLTHVVLVGRSLGTGVATEMAARGHGRALVLVAPFTSMIDMGRTLVGRLAPLLLADRFDTAAKAPRVRHATLVLHGTRDEVVPFEMGQRLAALLPNARLLAIEGFGHNDLPDLAPILTREVPALLNALPEVGASARHGKRRPTEAAQRDAAQSIPTQRIAQHGED